MTKLHSSMLKRLISVMLCLGIAIPMIIPAVFAEESAGGTEDEAANVTFTSSDGSAKKGSESTDIVNSITASVITGTQTAKIDHYNYAPGENGSAHDIIIPSHLVTADGTQYPVAEIGPDAFSGCELTSLGFADGSQITTIGARAFASNAFIDISGLPESIKTLGDGCFLGCETAKTINLSSMTGLTGIPAECFRDCKAAQDITLPDNITSIGANAFYECSELGHIVIPESVETIGNLAFRNCLDEMVIDCSAHRPSSLKGMPWGAVSAVILWSKEAGYNNDSPFVIGEKDGLIYGLKTAKIYDEGERKSADPGDYNYTTRTSFDDYRYYAYKSSIANPDMKHDFTNNSDVGNFTVAGEMKSNPDKVTYKNKQYTTALKINSSGSVTFTPKQSGKLVLVLGDNNSEGGRTCTNICIKAGEGGEHEYYDLPKKDDAVNGYVFTHSVDAGKQYEITRGEAGEIELYLAEVYYDEPEKYYSCIDLVEGELGEQGLNSNFKIAITIPKEVHKMDPETRKVSDETITINGIADGAFGSRPANHVLKSVDLSELNSTKNEIPDGAFWYCQSLEDVLNIPDSITRIGKNAFRQCQALTEITLPSELETIDYWAFRQCTRLETVTIDSTGHGGEAEAPIANIDTGAFSRCPQLKDFYIEGKSFGGEENDKGLGGSIFGVDTTIEGGTNDKQTQSHPFGANYAKIHYKNFTVPERTVQASNEPEWYFNRITGDVVFYNGQLGEEVDLEIPKQLTWNNNGTTETVYITGVGQQDENIELFYWNDNWYRKEEHNNSSGVKGINKLILHEGISRINDSAFYRADVKSVDLTKASNLDEIAYRAFGANKEDNFNIGNIEFPESLKRIEDLAFSNRTLVQTNKDTVQFGEEPTEVGVLTIPKFMDSVAAGAFSGAKGVGKIVIKQYNFLDNDPDYKTMEDQYKKSPPEVASYAPFGFDAYGEGDNRYTILVEYMDEAKPEYSDYELDKYAPRNPIHDVKGKPAPMPTPAPGEEAVVYKDYFGQPYSTVNEAVINLGVIMRLSETSVDSVYYIRNEAYDREDERNHNANTEWWAEEATLTERQSQWNGAEDDRPGEDGTPSDNGNGDYNGDIPYWTDLTGIKGNGTATFKTRFLSLGTNSEFRFDHYEAPIDVFHTQTYNANGGANEPAVTGGNGADGDTKNWFVEGYGAPVVGQGNMKKENALFLGWYVVEEGEELPEGIKEVVIATKDVHNAITGEKTHFIPNDAAGITDSDANTGVKLAMGDKNRTLYAVWAANDNDDKGDTTPDYLEPGSLTISKTVESSETEQAPADANFTFTVKLTPEDGDTIADSYNYTGSSVEGSGATAPVDGTLALAPVANSTAKTGTVTLKAGQTVTINDIPEGTIYAVSETAIPDHFQNTGSNSNGGRIAARGEAKAVFVNTYSLSRGALQISKNVVGDEGADSDTPFTFNVTIDGTVTGFDDIKFDNDKVKASGNKNFIVTLRDGESTTIGNIPADNETTYKVTEEKIPDNYELKAQNGTEGTIDTSSTKSAVFINTYNAPPGTLKITKAVDGDTAPETDTFTFNVSLKDAGDNDIDTADLTLDGEPVTDDAITVTLAAGEEAIIGNIPAGTKYTVTETPKDNYTSKAVGNAGTIESDETATAAFTNTYTAPPGSLTISKRVTGEGANSNTVFTFTVELSGDKINGADITTENNDNVDIKPGSITAKLKDGESATISGIPAGTAYTVTETNIPTNYSAAKRSITGTIESMNPAKAEFVNNYTNPAAPPVESPTASPTTLPTETPTDVPTDAPTDVPTETPTDVPTETPTDVPTDAPTSVPTNVPTQPTNVPTNAPTGAPTSVPTDAPTGAPTSVPTNVPTQPTGAPTQPTDGPTATPTDSPGSSGVQGAHSSGGSSSTSVKVEKQWKDNNDAAGMRPKSITVNVMNGDKAVSSHELSASNNWKYTFTGLPKTSGGKTVVYTVEEDPVKGYKANYVKSTTGYVIENEYVGDDDTSKPGESPKPDTQSKPGATSAPGEPGGSGNSPGGNPGGSGAPLLNHDDHYAYVIGYPNGEVRPYDKITRAEVATIFFRLLEDDSRTRYWSKTNGYPDVTADNWYNNAVSTLTKAGIVEGYDDGKFRGDAPVTRAEFAAIAARFDSGTYDGDDIFPDIGGHWAGEYINRAAIRGWINGYDDGTFRPNQPITRAEAMTLINGVLDRRPVDESALTDGMIVWKDNSDTAAWYYIAVQEATNSHYWESAGTGYERWTGLRGTRDWSALEQENATAASAGFEN